MSPTNHIAMADEAPQRGDIWIVQRGPSIGGEIQRTRPAVILSDDIANGLLRRVGRLPDEDMVAVGRVVGMHLGL